MVQCDVSESGTAVELRISGDVDVANVLALQEQVASVIAIGRDLIVDLDAVTRLDGAGVQLLVSLLTFVTRNGGAMSVVANADVPKHALEMAGAMPVLCPSDLPRDSVAQ